MKMLLLGIGNPILGDDGIGWRVVQAVRQELPGPTHSLDLDCISVGGLELVERISGYDQVILVDAIQSPDGISGRINRLTAADILRQPVNQSHGLTFSDALVLARQLNIPIPDQITIFTVEINEQIEFSDTLSSAVEVSLAAVVHSVLNEIKTDLAGHR